MKHCHWLIPLLAVTTWLAGAGRSVAQPSIALTSPSQLMPGDTVTLNVLGVESGTVTVGGELLPYYTAPPSGIQKAAPPYSFAFTLPTQIPSGTYALQAFVRTNGGPLISSSPQQIYVGTTASISSLSSSPKSILLWYQGDQQNVAIYGNDATGREDVTGDRQTSCVSSDPAIFLVKPPCTVVALKSGNGTIGVRNGSLTLSVPLTVDISALRGDFNNDGVVDQNDVQILTLQLNKPVQGAGDARDLNGDGKINALDARIEATLCTHPGCAVQ